MDVRLPVLAVEGRYRKSVESVAIEAAHVHVDRVRMRSWRVEGMHAARFAERVLRDMRVERVRRERLVSVQKRETLFRNDEVNIPLHPTDRTIAIEREVLAHFDAKSHRTAMASAFVRWHVEKSTAAPS